MDRKNITMIFHRNWSQIDDVITAKVIGKNFIFLKRRYDQLKYTPKFF